MAHGTYDDLNTKRSRDTDNRSSGADLHYPVSVISGGRNEHRISASIGDFGKAVRSHLAAHDLQRCTLRFQKA